MPDGALYLDTSALVKLVVSEPETNALLRLLADWPNRASSAIARVELGRVLKRIGAAAPVRRRGSEVLSRIALVRLEASILRSAESIDPPTLRALDAIHLATALSFGEELGGFVTYDARLGSAANSSGARILTPR